VEGVEAVSLVLALGLNEKGRPAGMFAMQR
jgi:hypothetical protein